MLPFRELFNEALDEYFDKNSYLNQSNIYYLCKVKKVRFSKENTQILQNNFINFHLKCANGKELQVKKSIFSVSQDAKSIRDHITSIQTEFSFEELIYFEINSEKSDSEYIEINIRLVGNEDKSNIQSFKIYPINVWANDDNVDLNNPPEIIYIGQSENILKRFRSHKTVLKAVSQLSDSEELFHYLITFKVGYGSSKEEFKEDSKIMSLLPNMDRKNDNYWSLINILERILIYFYQPQLNELHMNTPIEKDKAIDKFLKKDNIIGMTIGVGVNGKTHAFWSPNQKLNDDFFSFNFTTPEKGFTKGLDDDLLRF